MTLKHLLTMLSEADTSVTGAGNPDPKIIELLRQAAKHITDKDYVEADVILKGIITQKLKDRLKTLQKDTFGSTISGQKEKTKREIEDANKGEKAAQKKKGTYDSEDDEDKETLKDLSKQKENKIDKEDKEEKVTKPRKKEERGTKSAEDSKTIKVIKKD